MNNNVLRDVPNVRFSEYLGFFLFNQWIFVTSHSTTIPKNGFLISHGSILIASRSSGVSDYYAEWRYFPGDNKFKLLVAPYSDCESIHGGNTHVILQVHTIGDVMEYCQNNIHVHAFEGVPLE